MMLTLGVVTLTWWGAAVAAPAMLAARALRLGRRALGDHDFPRAEQWLERAAQRADLKQVALCLMAESALRARRAGDALLALEDLRDEGDGDVTQSRRARLLRGVACCVLRQGPGAQRVLAKLADRTDASPEELLAMAQASLVADDLTATRVYLGMIREEQLGGAVQARFRLCLAILFLKEGLLHRAAITLPDAEACSPADRPVVTLLRRRLGGGARPAGGAPEISAS